MNESVPEQSTFNSQTSFQYVAHSSIINHSKPNPSTIDRNIDNARKIFYGFLMGKKRTIRRNWLQMSAILNQHLLETLPYRTMVQNQTNNEWNENNLEGIQDSSDKNHHDLNHQGRMLMPHTVMDISEKCSGELFTSDDENIVPKIGENTPEGHDDWLDAETDLEIQRILNEEDETNSALLS